MESLSISGVQDGGNNTSGGASSINTGGLKPSSNIFHKGHKRAMSHQYQVNHNSSSSGSGPSGSATKHSGPVGSPDYNSLNLDYPLSATPGFYHHSHSVTKTAPSATTGLQLINSTSSATNLRMLGGGATADPSDLFSGTQLTIRATGHNTSTSLDAAQSKKDDDVAIDTGMDSTSGGVGGKPGMRKTSGDKKDLTDTLSLCSLPPSYSEMKGYLQETLDTGNVSDTGCADNKLKVGIMTSKTIRNELKKTFLAFLFQQVAQLIMIYTVVKSNDRMDLESPVLPDLVLSRVPLVKWAGQWSEILLFTLFLVFTLNILFHKHRFLVLRRVLAVTGICLVIRSFCVWATVLPRSLGSMECAPKSRNSTEVLHRVFIMYITSGLSIFGGHMCGNYFFSGHTCLMTIVHAAFYQYTPDVFSPLKRLVTVLCLAIAALILLAHNHYTLDILGAYYVSSRVWMFYHFLAHNPQFRMSPQLSFAWGWLVNIFEDGSESQVKNEFQSVREIYHMICQQTETHNSHHHHHRTRSKSSQKLQTV